MNAIFKIRRDMLEAIHADLSRKHPFAAERVGFVACRLAQWARGDVGVLAQTYLPVADDHYENDPTVGAMMNAHAIRTALQHAFNHRTAMFHIHRHEHYGTPRFSYVDIKEAERFVPDFWKVQPALLHGALVLSRDQVHGAWWGPHARQPRSFKQYMIVGLPTEMFEEPQDE